MYVSNFKIISAVTSELTNALQLNIIGQTRNIDCVLDQCKHIYPSLFEQQVDQGDKSPDVVETDDLDEKKVTETDIPVLNLGKYLVNFL